jgi:hypothetical protein
MSVQAESEKHRANRASCLSLGVPFGALAIGATQENSARDMISGEGRVAHAKLHNQARLSRLVRCSGGILARQLSMHLLRSRHRHHPATSDGLTQGFLAQIMEGTKCFGQPPRRMPFLGVQEALGCAGRGRVVVWASSGLEAKRGETPEDSPQSDSWGLIWMAPFAIRRSGAIVPKPR